MRISLLLFVLFFSGLNLSADPAHDLEFTVYFRGDRYTSKWEDLPVDALKKMDFEELPPILLPEALRKAKEYLVLKFPRPNWAFNGAFLNFYWEQESRIWYWCIRYSSGPVDSDGNWFGPDIFVPIIITMDGKVLEYSIVEP